jgi:peptidyl-tRNA hydrolase, PTH1 family
MSQFLLVGLGNIGEDYEHTRHNIGFDVLDQIALKFEAKFKLDRHAYVAEIKYKGKSILLVKPTTYMNLSGKALNYWMQVEQIKIEHCIIITDDLSLPVGKIRIRPKGSDGGHNGLKHIEETLKHQDYARLRVGIGSDFPKGFQSDYVLGQWTEEEAQLLNTRIPIIADALLAFTTLGLERTMNLYNGK